MLQRIEGCCDRAQIDSNIAHMVGLWSYAMEKVPATGCEGFALSLRVPVWHTAWAVCRNLASLDGFGYSPVLTVCLDTAMGRSFLVLVGFFSRWQVRQCQCWGWADEKVQWACRNVGWASLCCEWTAGQGTVEVGRCPQSSSPESGAQLAK